MFRSLFALFALAATAVAVATDPPRPRGLIDFNPWAWLPTDSKRSPAVMDYFFPPSRTPKQSNLDPPSDRQPPSTTTTLDDAPISTTQEETSATTARKSSSKTKTTVPTTHPTATAPPKMKKSTHKAAAPKPTTDLETTQTTKVESSYPAKNITASSTNRPTKHYTIKPFVRTTETPTVQDMESTLNTNSDSTETVSVFETTAEDAKETAPTLSTAARSTDEGTASTVVVESTTQADSTAEPADSREGYLPLRDKPQQTHVKINEQTKKETVPLPAGSTSVLAKPTKYHYYPHNQHIYLLPECAIQQVCNAVYVRLNYTQPLCACPARYRDPCSASLNADDLHTTRLTTDSKKKYAHKAVTLVKTCEAVSEMRECRAPRDWSLLALQNIRTGKSHYLVICRCPENHILEGPMSHDQPTYASVPGIRVYGMMCVRPTTTAYHTGYNGNRFTGASIQSTTSAYKVDYSQPQNQEKPVYNRYQSPGYLPSNFYNRRSRVARVRRTATEYPPFPWYKVLELARSLHWIN